jgi:hypothetical protein
MLAEGASTEGRADVIGKVDLVDLAAAAAIADAEGQCNRVLE